MYYSAGVANLAVFGSAVALPQEGLLWHVARLMLDCAGGLFGAYLVTALGLSLIGRVMRLRGHTGTARSRMAVPAPCPEN